MLSFKKGEVIKISGKSDERWYTGQLSATDKEGLVSGHSFVGS
jgi:hypothetical protein